MNCDGCNCRKHTGMCGLTVVDVGEPSAAPSLLASVCVSCVCAFACVFLSVSAETVVKVSNELRQMW